ncbi:hypothetical protein JCM19237_3746 [Photobacterium aphoticum]|uniref:Uncharacterized protein n=1 Tax=Photobacterium aphoticum TaxID=754436 RepID=A0A090R2Q0_9GAMM|nr:hypothetical protein JCM19237_3746 [Photobacterium aphoticum]
MDPGSHDRPSWWKWELNQSWFWNLGPLGEVLDQQVVAFNVYTGDIPTWDQTETVNGEAAFRRPPAYAGMRLGDYIACAALPVAAMWTDLRSATAWNTVFCLIGSH